MHPFEILTLIIYASLVCLIYKVFNKKKNPLKSIGVWMVIIISPFIFVYVGNLMFIFAVGDDGDTELKEGYNKELYKNGKDSVEYVVKNNKIEGLYKTWYENGHLEKVMNFRNGNQIDSSFEYHSNGKLYLIETFKEGKRQKSISFHANGQIREVSTFDIYKSLYGDSRYLTGDSLVTYFSNGAIESTIKIKNGSLNGPAIFYYKNGKPRIIGQFKDDQKDEEWKLLDSIKSKKMQTITFKYPEVYNFPPSWDYNAN